jgi:hypothetical protein
LYRLPNNPKSEGTKMRKVLIALVVAALASGSAVASDKDDVMALLKHTVAAFNKDDMKAMAADCAASASIIDEFAPYTWQGATACADWGKDADALNAKMGITDAILTPAKPWTLEVTGDRAYAVIPTKLTFKMKGKNQKEAGSVWTFALQKSAEGWKIAAWTWSKH